MLKKAIWAPVESWKKEIQEILIDLIIRESSKIFENKSPDALPGETQKWVNIWFGIYTIVYGVFDKIIHVMDRDAYKANTLPNWFMTFVSMYGLGFQLLIIAVMLPLGWIELIVPFFIVYSGFIFVLIGIRKVYLK